MRLFRYISKALLVTQEVAVNRFTVEEDRPSSRLDQTRQHFECRGFARAIGAQVARDLSGPDNKAHVLYGGNPGIKLRDFANFKHEIRSPTECGRPVVRVSGLCSRL